MDVLSFSNLVQSAHIVVNNAWKILVIKICVKIVCKKNWVSRSKKLN